MSRIMFLTHETAERPSGCAKYGLIPSTIFKLLSDGRILTWWRTAVRVIVVGAGVYNQTSAQEFHISGTLEGEYLFEKKVTKQLQRTQFDVSVRGCNWVIRLEPGLLGGSVEAAYDGDVIRIAAKGDFKPTASVLNSKAPLGGADPRMAILWTAFAQSCYLRESVASGFLIPAFSHSFFRKPIPAIVEGLTDSQMLPSRIVYFATATNILDNGQTIRRQPPFENGFTNAIYAALNFTNVGAVRIPSEFEFNQFQPSAVRPASSNDIRVCLHCVGKIYMAEAKCTVTNFSIDLPTGAPVLVNDMRFLTPDRGYLPILYKTNRWLSRSEVQSNPSFNVYTQQEALLAKIGNPLPRNDQPHSAGRHNRAVALVIFVGVSAIAALILFLRRPRCNRENTENKN